MEMIALGSTDAIIRNGKVVANVKDLAKRIFSKTIKA